MNNIKIIVPVSGGKDSQSCLKLAIQKHGVENVEGLFCDTQWEHPLTYEHLELLSEKYGVKIHKVSGGSVPEKVRKYKRFPVLGIRFCTEELKIRETRIFLKEYAKEHQNIQVWYGMRLEESHKRRKKYADKIDMEEYLPHEINKKYPKYLGKMGVRFVLPVLSWSAEEVLDFIKGEENPLYSMGFDRVGCFPCLAACDAQKHRAFTFDDFGKSQFKVVKILEEETNKSVFTTKNYKNKYDKYDNETNGCAICSI